MLQTTIAFEGNIATDVEVTYTPTSKQVVKFVVLVNRRRQDTETGEWTDSEPTRHSCVAFGQLGDNVAGSAVIWISQRDHGCDLRVCGVDMPSMLVDPMSVSRSSVGGACRGSEPPKFSVCRF